MSRRRTESILLGRYGRTPRSKARMRAITADITWVNNDSGVHFFVTFASDVDITLPAVTLTGWHATVTQTVDQEMILHSAEGNNILADNDLAASTIIFTAAGDQIGAGFYVVSTGTKWIVQAQAPIFSYVVTKT